MFGRSRKIAGRADSWRSVPTRVFIPGFSLSWWRSLEQTMPLPAATSRMVRGVLGMVAVRWCFRTWTRWRGESHSSCEWIMYLVMGDLCGVAGLTTAVHYELRDKTQNRKIKNRKFAK